jgi:hypothetical protein
MSLKNQIMQKEFIFETGCCKMYMMGLVDPQLLFIIDKAWFYISGHANTQNVKIWNNENPHAIEQVSLHSEKIGV